MKNRQTITPERNAEDHADEIGLVATGEHCPPPVWRKRKPRTRGLCSECFYFGANDLTCRRKAPHLTYGTWPNVKPDDWCGDYVKYLAPG